MSDYSQTHCAIYLRGNAQAIERQRQDIQRALVQPFGITQVTEYAEAESGRNPDRPVYRAMLEDAAAGRIQMILVATPDRLGHDAVEAMRAMQELLEYKVEIRFASLPDAVSYSKERLLMNIFFYLARAESEQLRRRRGQGGA
jgi:DNA invertase Pin-like site-specific DNA recombinase